MLCLVCSHIIHPRSLTSMLWISGLDRAYRQVREYMGLQQRRQKVHYDKLCNGKPFKIGDMVWLHCPAVPRGKSPKLHCY